MAPTNVTVIVVPDFNLSATMGFIDAFRAANYLQNATLFTWQITSPDGGLIRASNGVEVGTEPLDRQAPWRNDIVVVSSSWTPERYFNSPILGFLRQQYQTGARLAGIDTGGFILARGGFLNEKAATVHYEHLDAFIELFPDVEAKEDICVFEDRVMTCCGGGAAVDFGLWIVRGLHGDALANAAARYIFQGSIRHPNTRQNSEVVEPIGSVVPSLVKKAINVMEANLETPLSIPDLAVQVGISTRQLNRLFADYVRKPPSVYYRDIRLDRARGLVTQTEMPIAEVALASGFACQVNFGRAYKARFGATPTGDRVDGRVPFAYRAWPMFGPGSTNG
ncbi:MAG: GlxA family transcriptional regulator [Pseudomonadota bacterium]